MSMDFNETFKDYSSFVKGSVIVIVTNILLTLNSLFLMPIIANNYSVNELGLWAQLSTTSSLISTISTLGLTYSMTRFLASKTDKDEIQEQFNTILCTIAIVLLIMSIIILLFVNPIAYMLFEGKSTITLLLIPLIVLSCINSILFNYFRTFNRIKLYSALMVLEIYIRTIIIAYLAFSGYNLNMVIWGVVISYLSASFCMFYLVSRDISFKLPRFKNLKEYLKFGLPTLPNDLAFWVLEFGDRYIMQFLIGIVAVGYYSPGSMLGNYILMVCGPLSVLLAPILSKNFDEGKIVEVKNIMRYSFKYLFLVSMPLICILSLFSKQILLIIANPEAIQSYLITPFAALSALIYGIYIIISQIILLYKKTNFITYSWLGVTVLNLGLNYLLIPQIGILAAAIVNLMTFTILTTLTFVYSFKFIKFSFQINLKDVIKIISASILMIIPFLFIYPNTPNHILICSILALIFYIVILNFMNIFNKNEKKVFKLIIENSLSFIKKKYQVPSK